MKKMNLLLCGLAISNSVTVYAVEIGNYKSLANSMSKDYINICYSAGYVASKGEIMGRKDLINWGEIMMQSYSRLSTYRWTEDEYMKNVVPHMDEKVQEFNKLDEARKSKIFFTCMKNKNKKLDELFSEVKIRYNL